VISARRGEKIGQVIADMKKYGISQMPVVELRRQSGGHDPRVRLLKRRGRRHPKLNDAVDTIISPLQGVVTPETTLAKLRESSPRQRGVVREARE